MILCVLIKMPPALFAATRSDLINGLIKYILSPRLDALLHGVFKFRLNFIAVVGTRSRVVVQKIAGLAQPVDESDRIPPDVVEFRRKDNGSRQFAQLFFWHAAREQVGIVPFFRWIIHEKIV